LSIYQFLAYLAVVYYLIYYSIHSLFLALGYREASRWKKLGYLEETHRLSRSELVPPVSLVIELHTGGEEAVGWVDHALAQRFPETETIVMCRPGNEEMIATLVGTYFLRRVDRVYKRVLEAPQPLAVFQSDDRRLVLVLMETESRGKALNMAVNLSRYPLVAVAGRGVRLEEDALLRLVRPFMMGERYAPLAMGVSLPLDMEEGNQLPPRRVTRFALMESLRVQLAYQAGAPSLGGPVATYSPLMVFRKEDLVAAGGFDNRLPFMGAEAEMTLRLHRSMRDRGKAYRFAFLPQLLSRRPFPRTWRDHFRESGARRRGIADALWSGRDMLLKARYGYLGTLYIPIFWLFIQFAAAVDIAAYAAVISFFILGKIGWGFLAAFLAASLAYPAVVGVGAVAAARHELEILGGHGALLYGYAASTQLWFRQITALAAFFVFRGGGKEEA